MKHSKQSCKISKRRDVCTTRKHAPLKQRYCYKVLMNRIIATQTASRRSRDD